MVVENDRWDTREEPDDRGVAWARGRKGLMIEINLPILWLYLPARRQTSPKTRDPPEEA